MFALPTPPRLGSGFALLALAIATLPVGGAPDARAAGPTCAILVSPLGSDAAGCGLSASSPCRTIGHAYSRAVTEGLSCVFVRAGSYAEVVVPVAGVDLIGGFNASWQPGSYLNPDYQAIIVGGLDTGPGGVGEYLTVRANGLSVLTRITDLVLRGPNAVGAAGLNGRTTYVVHARASLLALERVQIEAGSGSPGLTGAGGLDAISLTRAGSGTNGGDGAQYNTTCDATSRGSAGLRGTNACSQSPGSQNMNGGAGGQGGTMDTNCGIFSLDLNATNGFNGSNADFISGSLGLGGQGVRPPTAARPEVTHRAWSRTARLEPVAQAVRSWESASGIRCPGWGAPPARMGAGVAAGAVAAVVTQAPTRTAPAAAAVGPAAVPRAAAVAAVEAAERVSAWSRSRAPRCR